MEVISDNFCPACGSRDRREACSGGELKKSKFRNLSSQKYQGQMDGWEEQLSLSVIECVKCHHLWHRDRPDQRSIFEMYAAAARRKVGKEGAGNQFLIPAIRKQIKGLRSAVGGVNRPKFLDYGSGGGAWSAVAREFGFDVWSYEPVSERQGVADGVSVTNSKDDLKAEMFDVINLEQVLEHMTNPLQELMFLRSICAPSGLIRISVPDVGQARIQPGFWDNFPYSGRMHILSPYEHLQGFNGISLRHLISRADLKERLLPSQVMMNPRYCVKRVLSGLGLGSSPTFLLASPSRT